MNGREIEKGRERDRERNRSVNVVVVFDAWNADTA